MKWERGRGGMVFKVSQRGGRKGIKLQNEAKDWPVRSSGEV